MNEDGLSVLELGPHRPPYLLVSNPHLVGEFLRASGSQPNRPGFSGIHVKRSRYTVNGKAGSKGKFTKEKFDTIEGAFPKKTSYLRNDDYTYQVCFRRPEKNGGV